MWSNTAITRLCQLHYPIIQAPMAGGATTPELVAAVSNTGGLGSIGAGYLSPEQLQQQISQVRQLTDKPFAVNLFVPTPHQATPAQIQQMNSCLRPYLAELGVAATTAQSHYAPDFGQQMEVVLANNVPVFSFTFGIPEKKWLVPLKASQTTVIGTATTVAEGLALATSGVDAVVAQGYEAGGHRGTFLAGVADSLIGTMALVPQMVDVLPCPVIASGGIMDARGVAAALTLGATAVQMGTAFLTCDEAGINPAYQQQLLSDAAQQTVLTRAFSGKAARGVKNKFTQEMQQHEADILDYPIQNVLTRQLRKTASQRQQSDYMSLWAGQAASLAQQLPAADLIKQLVEGVDNLWRKSSSLK